MKQPGDKRLEAMADKDKLEQLYSLESSQNIQEDLSTIINTGGTRFQRPDARRQVFTSFGNVSRDGFVAGADMM
jgi:hypothetical protein